MLQDAASVFWKEVREKLAEDDFWEDCRSANWPMNGRWAGCDGYWKDEIFVNCIDAEVWSDAPTPQPTPGPPTPPVPTPAPTPAPTSHPVGTCIHQPDCSINPWCRTNNMQWCIDNGRAGNCPAPQCFTVVTAE